MVRQYMPGRLVNETVLKLRVAKGGSQTESAGRETRATGDPSTGSGQVLEVGATLLRCRRRNRPWDSRLRTCRRRGSCRRSGWRAVLANRRFARLQLAAAAADHVALRQVNLGRVGILFLLHRILANLFLYRRRQTIASIHRRQAVCAMPLPHFVLRHPIEIAEKRLIGLIDAKVARFAVDELHAPVRVITEADHVRRPGRRRSARIGDPWPLIRRSLGPLRCCSLLPRGLCRSRNRDRQDSQKQARAKHWCHPNPPERWSMQKRFSSTASFPGAQ